MPTNLSERLFPNRLLLSIATGQLLDRTPCVWSDISRPAGDKTCHHIGNRSQYDPRPVSVVRKDRNQRKRHEFRFVWQLHPEPIRVDLANSKDWYRREEDIPLRGSSDETPHRQRFLLDKASHHTRGNVFP